MGQHISTWAPSPAERARLSDAMLALHKRGVAAPAIAVALDVFLSVGLTPLQVRRELRRLGMPRSNRGGRNPVPRRVSA